MVHAIYVKNKDKNKMCNKWSGQKINSVKYRNVYV
jgi:hypothetical protein